MKTIVLDCDQMTGREADHDYLARELSFPEWYGRNLDALYDFLTERAAGWRVVFTGCAGAEERLPSYMRSLQRMCQDAEAETPELYIAFLP